MNDFFKRVEKKYIITEEQYKFLTESMKNNMIEDEYGESTICNIYFDTENYDLIRHSITKPIYKDKVRLRSYNTPNLDSTVYLEVKRKYEGVVSKRRIEMALRDFYKYIENRNVANVCQIQKELNYYFDYYKLIPTMFLSYDRRAYYDKDDRDFRITFDSNILARDYDLKIEHKNVDINIFEDDKYIMEIKTLGAIPMWLARLLSELKLSPCGFSKYGEAYTQLVLNANQVSEYVV